jgi:hypothetical protein
LNHASSCQKNLLDDPSSLPIPAVAKLGQGIPFLFVVRVDDKLIQCIVGEFHYEFGVYFLHKSQSHTAAVRGGADPHEDLFCLAVDSPHEMDLRGFFEIIGLIYAGGINP